MSRLVSRLSSADLAAYVGRQVHAFFPDGEAIDADALADATVAALERLEHCFAGIHLKYYRDGSGRPAYDPLHTDQHAAFLYLLSHALHRDGATTAAAKVYALNKALHALDVFYEVELPPVFYFQHPLGSVLGRADYGDYLAVYQGVTVGADLEDRYPRLGDGVVLYGGARVIGAARLGDNTWVAPAAIVLGEEFPPDSILFGQPPTTGRKPSRRDVRRDFFRHPETV